MVLFTIASCLPFALLTLAATLGGVWGWLALGSMTALVFGLDRLLPRNLDNADPEAEFPASVPLLVVLGLGHFGAMLLLIHSFAPSSPLTAGDKALCLITAGLIFGQISHPVAHELIHKPPRALRLLARLIYSSLLVGHHASAHVRVHHVHVATDADPNSARQGESFYRFALRATDGSFRAGLRAENRLRQGRSVWSHPYVLYVGVGALSLLVAAALGGGAGFAAVLCASLHAQMQILLSDYVQHYGLRRRLSASGRPEPVGPQHSWNAAQRYSSALTLNAPRHSDHHVTPSRVYPALQLHPAQMPMLPRSLPVMAMIAMMPRRWRRMMDPRCRKWQPSEQEGL